MSQEETKTLVLSPSPHVHAPHSVKSCMYHVIIALLPSVVCGFYYFGMDAVMVTLVAIVSCAFFEWAITRFMLGRKSTIADGSAILTGLLLACNVPSSLPLWMVVIGSLVAIGIAKMAFGGIGCNIFNPALVGRVFLLISFPVAMTTRPLPGGGFAGAVDGATGATLLARLKTGAIDGGSIDYLDLVLGNAGGSIGEVGAFALLIGFVYLLVVKVITWHVPVSILLSVAVFSLLVGAPVGVELLSGGLLLGAVFMATDYVTSPMTSRGKIIYGVLIGVITVVIRSWAAYPEGVSFAILLGNAVTPLINKYVKPRRFSKGGK
jgi:electron transport complex protein RnfD